MTAAEMELMDQLTGMKSQFAALQLEMTTAKSPAEMARIYRGMAVLNYLSERL